MWAIIAIVVAALVGWVIYLAYQSIMKEKGEESSAKIHPAPDEPSTKYTVSDNGSGTGGGNGAATPKEVTASPQPHLNPALTWLCT